MIEAIIVQVLVAEEDYKYDLSEFEKFTNDVKAEIMRDVKAHETQMDNFVWQEQWLAPAHGDDYQCQDWELHSLVNRSVHVLYSESV